MHEALEYVRKATVKLTKMSDNLDQEAQLTIKDLKMAVAGAISANAQPLKTG